ncbi:PP2C family protein-serine/threonine phosphatase [Microbacterium sp. LWH3-1.2]|uniref:PP2C family protein-serine/threonine phosphatase n=1 Tax=Microbacterium sp. LWH3-1.2 TaxID=3135256 RepID=UPI0034484286
MEGSESDRLMSLRELQIFGTPPEERFDRITRLAREVFDVPVAEINFIDAERQFTKSPQPPGAEVYTPLDVSFCDVAVRSPGILVVPDAADDDRFSWKESVTGERHVRFYAGRPLSVAGGPLVGTLCLVDTKPRDFGTDQQLLLDQMGTWVERELHANAEMELAARVQGALLPASRKLAHGFSIAAHSRPIGVVGGDFYAWHDDGSHVTLLLADAMGKGVAGAIIAATVRAVALGHLDVDPVALLRSIDRRLDDDFRRTQTFATAFAARVELSSGEIEYADAGHGLSAVLRADGTIEPLPATGMPLGLSLHAEWTVRRSRLASGDSMISVTDGALDLGDGTVHALNQVFAAIDREGDAGARLAPLLASLDAVTLTDDVAAVVLTRT